MSAPLVSFRSVVLLLGPCLLGAICLAPARAGGAQAFVQEARIDPADPTAFALFGWSVAASGDTAVIGASGSAAYVFRRTGTSWSQEQEILATSGVFASAVAVSGDTLVIGAYGDDALCPSDPNCNSGAAHVYARAGTTWSLQQSLFAADAAPGDLFGYSVAIAGDSLVVGARDGDAPGAANSGAAYVYVRSGTTWSLQQELVAADAAPDDQFGIAVALGPGRALIGAAQTSGSFFRQGSVYSFARSGTTWTEQQQFVASDEGQLDAFGSQVSLSGTAAAIGAPGNSAAYVFRRTGPVWSEEALLVAPDAAPEDGFAASVSISGDTLLVGAPNDDDTGSLSGSAYLFQRVGASWTASQKLTALDAEPGDQFGWSGALADDSAVISAVSDAGGGSQAGTAYAFARVAAPFVAFCDASDGALAACPCANPGLPDTGCENAQSTGGVRCQVTAFDAPNLFATVLGSGYPVDQRPATIVMRASDAEATPQVFDDGVRCVGTSGFTRLNARLARDGVSRHVLQHEAGPGTFHYQIWYRSTPIGYCDPTAAANTSGGVSITW